jgi:glyoxylase-like metal-dependent hydrolase (beta-lactamase superfamily II)
MRLNLLSGLPPDITVLERGWLSSNNILLTGSDSCALIDSGYVTHAPQTLALLRHALADRLLDVLVNTHLHSDHCGGNASLQGAYPSLVTYIPPGLAHHVSNWDPQALTYAPTGQSCTPFRFDALLRAGDEVQLGQRRWQVHSAPGHDPHSVLMFEPDSRVLVSADALWENGFGVVFQELEGVDAFGAVGQTIDLIESLNPKIVIPGHGRVFDSIAPAVARARTRLESFMRHPERHIKYASKVLLKFKLLEVQTIELDAFLAWASATPYFAMIFNRHFKAQDWSHWIAQLVDELVSSGAAARDGGLIRNMG